MSSGAGIAHPVRRCPIATILCQAAAVLLGGCVATGGEQRAEPSAAPAQVAAATAAPQVATPNNLVLSPLPPRWVVGDRWQWSDGYGLRVSRAEPGRTTFERTDAESQWQQRDTLFLTGLKSASAERQMVFRTDDPKELFPLQIGKQVVFEREYLSNGELRRHRTSWVVEGRERIEVPAGSFDTWVLVRRTRSTSTEWTGYERWWYSPAVRHYVRLEYRYGEQPPGTRVLMEYQLASE